MTCAEAQELITALADREIAPADRSEVEGHLKECARCRQVFDQERLIKSAARSAASRVNAPTELRNKILSDRRIFPETRQAGWRDLLWPPRPTWHPAFVLSLLVLLALPVLFLLEAKRQPISLAVVDTHEKITQGRVAFIRAASEQEVLEKLTRAVAGRFSPMGYDLSMIRLRAVGGTTREMQGRKILVAVYEGEGPTLTCYTFLGRDEDAPQGAQVTVDTEKKILFYSYSVGELNAVLHREGKITCILVSKMPMADLLALARAKAHPA